MKDQLCYDKNSLLSLIDNSEMDSSQNICMVKTIASVPNTLAYYVKTYITLPKRLYTWTVVTQCVVFVTVTDS